MEIVKPNRPSDLQKHGFSGQWKNLAQCKERFWDQNEDPRVFPDMNPEVAESWIRSKKNGIDPYCETIGNKLPPQDFEAVVDANRLLIDTTIPLIHSFKYLFKLPGYLLALLDHSETILCIEGDSSAISDFRKINATVGSVWREDTVGTTAHVLSMTLRRPLQLIGPEHYCVALQGKIASAAPILDQNGDVMATLVLVQPILNSPEDYPQNLDLQTLGLGLITAMANAIEAQVKLKKSNDHLKNMNDSLTNANEQLEAANLKLQMVNQGLTIATNTLEATLVSIDEGIVTIDHEGNIIRINPEGSRIFRQHHDEFVNTNIFKFIGNQSGIERTLKDGEIIHFAEVSVHCGYEEQSYLFSVRPVFDQDKNHITGAVVRITPPDKINTLLNNRAGARARYEFNDIVGTSEAIDQAKQIARKFAVSTANILLIGESGTGKELFAQAIHNEYRPTGPFIAINCAAMPRNLIESELFGYEGGSFTGAERQGRPGKIELANGGTLFLDEIGDMPFEIQAVLLRVLEDKQVMRIGGRKYQPVDFRMVAATNKDLRKMVEEKQFREDLYYRLSVLKVIIPPLRERDNDALLLSQFFINNYCRRTGQTAPVMSPAAREKILAYHWPGNVRQLENAMTYAVNMAGSGIINLEQLPEDLFFTRGLSATEQSGVGIGNKVISVNKNVIPMRILERTAIENALFTANNHVQHAADLLEISKSTMYRKLKEYAIEI